MAVEIAMQWNESYGESVYTFANTINTHEGGTHEEGFRAALTGVVNKYGTDKKLLKGDEKLSGEDIREGLAAIISVKLAEPAVRGPDQDQARQHRHEELRAEGLQRVAGRLVRAQPGRGQDDHHQGDPRRPGPGSPPRRPASWPAASRCWSPARCRASWPTASPPTRASPSCSSSRATRPAARPSRAATRVTQAILPIRGKILNVEKARIDRVLKNNEVQALITALGTGIHDEFDIAKLRYHKVVLMADADVDGQHIQTLLLTLLFRFMRPLVELGHVYLAAPPLYKIKWNKKGDDAQYAYSDRERDGLIALRQQKKPNAKPDDIQRFKGLGEMNYHGAVGDHHEPGDPDATPGHAGRRRDRGRVVQRADGRGRRGAAVVHPAQRQGRPFPGHLTGRRCRTGTAARGLCTAAALSTAFSTADCPLRP